MLLASNFLNSSEEKIIHQSSFCIYYSGSLYFLGPTLNLILYNVLATKFREAIVQTNSSSYPATRTEINSQQRHKRHDVTHHLLQVPIPQIRVIGQSKKQCLC